MKRIVGIILAMSIVLGLFAGCGDKGTPSTSTGEVPPQTQQGEGGSTVGPTNSNPLSDVRVRQAIAYAIDMEAIIDGLMDGKAQPANVLMPNGDWKADGLEEYSYNPERSKQLLAEAGWDANYTLDVVYYYGDQMTVDMMAAIQQYLSDVGIKMNPRKLEGDLTSQLWVAPADPLNGPAEVSWDMAYAAIAALAPHEYYDRFHSGMSNNSHTPTDAELDKLIEATSATADVAEQQAAFKALEVYENQTLPELPLYYQQVFITQSDRLERGSAEYGNEQFNYDWDLVNWDIKADDSGKKVMRTNGGPAEFFEAPTLNPGLHMSTKVLYDHLIVADGSLNPKAGQLADYTMSDDGLTLEFTLKEGIKWHDGEAITGDDVKWTYEYVNKVPVLNPIFSSTLSALAGYDAFMDGSAEEISGIVVDGNKVTFTFAKVDPNALLTFSQLPPLPKKYFEGIDPLQFQQAPYFQNPIGSGPYKVSEVKMGDYVTFVPFEEYHNGVGKIEEIQMYPSGESDTNLVKNASAQQLDYAYTKAVEDVVALEGMTHMKVTPVDNRYTRLFYFNKFPKES